MNSYSYYVPGSLPFTPNSTRRTLEVNSIRAINFNTISILPANYALTANSNGSTYWSSDIMSTVYGLGSAGYISSLYTTLNLDYISSVVPLTFSAEYISTTGQLFISTGESTYQSIFSDGTISTHTCVVYGSNTFIVQGNILINDIARDILVPLILSNSRFNINYGNPYYINQDELTSTLKGSKPYYIDNIGLNSTLQGIIAGIKYAFIASTVEGLGTMSYISTSSLLSTTHGLILYGGAVKSNYFLSTVGGLRSLYISSQLNSTTQELYKGLNVISSNTLQSTVRLIANYYISSSALASTTTSLFSQSLYSESITSSINNLPYLSSTAYPLPVQNIISNLYLPEEVTSTINNLYNFNFPSLKSTVSYNVSSNVIINFNWIVFGSNASGYQMGYSSDGISWRNIPITIGTPINTIVKYKGIYVAATSDPSASLLYSYDGFTWKPVVGGYNLLLKVNSIAYSSNLILAAGSNTVTDNSIIYSLDGITWYVITVSNPFKGGPNSVANGIAYGNEVWVAAGYRLPGYPTIMYSRDGLNWLNALGSYPPNPTTGIAYYNNVWACGAQTANPTTGQKVYYSLDGSNWLNANNSDIFGGNVETLAQVGSLFFATCLDTIINIKYSTDGSNWQNVVNQGFPVLTSGSIVMRFAYNGTYIATLSTDNTVTSNSIITSTDGSNWTVNTNNDYKSCFGIIYSPSAYINYSNTLTSPVVPYNWITFGYTSSNDYNIATSLDGSNWNKFVFPLQVTVNSIFSYSNMYIACLNYTTSLLYSYDGQEWSLVTSGYNLLNNISQIAYNGSNLLVAVGKNATNGTSLLYSSDGLNWSFVNSGTFDYPSPINTSVIYSSNIWVAGGASSLGVKPIIYSFDGLNWLNASGPFTPSAPSAGLGFYNNIWVSGQYNTGLYYSRNGSNWSNANTAFPSVNSVSQAGSLWFATGSNATMNIKYSIDGSNWQNVITQGFSPISDKDVFINFAYNSSNLYVGTLQQVAGSYGKIITSPDGSNWTANTTDIFDNPTCILYSPYRSNVISISASRFNWIAAGQDIVLSEDGINWTSQSNPMTTVKTIITDSQRYIIGGNHTISPIQYSYNGFLWILTNAYYVLHTVNSIAYSSNLYVAVGQNPNTIAYSEDLVNWKPAVSGSFSNVGNSVSYGNGVWAATGYSYSGGPTILYSTDGSNWSNAVTGGFATIGNSILFNNDLWIAGGSGTSNIQYSLDGSNWSIVNVDLGGTISYISFTGNLWFASGYVQASQIIYYSSNGYNWFLGTGIYPANATAKNVAYKYLNLNMYVCPITYGSYNGFITSTDGSNWYYNSNSTTNNINSILYTNGIYYEVNSYVNYISTIDIQSTIDFCFSNYLIINDLQSSIDGLQMYVSTESLISTSESLIIQTVSLINLQSTIIGLGSIYVSSYYPVQSTVSDILLYSLSNSYLTSTVEGIQYITSSDLQSTIEKVLDPTGTILPIQLGSTVIGLGSGTFISSLSIASTIDSIFNSYLIDSNLVSTVDNLSLISYISSTDIASTLNSYFNEYPIDLTSTVDGLVYANYNISDDLASTFTDIDSSSYTRVDWTSTIAGLGNYYYISTSQLFSTTNYLYSNTIYKRNIESTIKGLGSLYVSSSALASTLYSFIRNTNLITTNNLFSSISGVGNKFISSAALNSTLTRVLGRYVLMDTIMSTVDGVGTAKYISSQHLASSLDSVYNTLLTMNGLQSTVYGLETTYVSTTDLTSTNDYLIATNITPPFLVSTVVGIGTVPYISSQSLHSTTSNFISNYFLKPVLISTVKGLGTIKYLSTSQLTSSVAFAVNPANFVSPSNLISTITGLGTMKYRSTIGLQSSINSIFERIIFKSTINSTINGLSLINISTSALTSTVDSFFSNYAIIDFYPSTIDGLGLFGFISTNTILSSINYINSNIVSNKTIISTVRGLGAATYISSASLRSTVTEFVKMTTYVPKYANYIIPYTNIVGLMTITSSLTGIGSANYISTSALRSTVSNFINPANVLTQSNINTGIRTIGQLYLSSTSLPSTIDAIWSLQIPPFYLFSTVTGLGSRYVSTVSLLSTTYSLVLSGTYGYSIDMYNQIKNLGTVNSEDSYISSQSMISTVYYILSNPKVSASDIASSVRGFGTASYISSSGLLSTTRGLKNGLLFYYPNIDAMSPIYGGLTTISISNLFSTTAKILSSSNISTPNIQKSIITNGLVFISTLTLTSTVRYLINNITTPNLLASTLIGLGSLYTSSSAITSTNSNFANVLLSKGDNLRSTFVALGDTYISTSRNITTDFNGNQLTSTFSTIIHGFEASNLQSSIGGLRSLYISTVDILSTSAFYIDNFIALNVINKDNLTSFTRTSAEYYDTKNDFAYKMNISSLSGNIRTLTGATNILYNALPSGPLNTFIACFISHQNNNTIWDIMYTYNGLNFETAITPDLLGRTMDAYSVIGYNGNVFMMPWASFTTNRTYLWYSFDAIYWFESSFTAPYSYYPRISSSSRLTVWTGNGTTGAYPYIGYFSCNNPNVWYPILTTYITPSLGFSATTFVASLQQVTNITNNGVFFVISGSFSGTYNAMNTACVLISYNASNWIQCNVGVSGTAPQGCFTIGQWNYVGDVNGCNYSRSSDGSNWSFNMIFTDSNGAVRLNSSYPNRARTHYGDAYYPNVIYPTTERWSLGNMTTKGPIITNVNTTYITYIGFNMNYLTSINSSPNTMFWTVFGDSNVYYTSNRFQTSNTTNVTSNITNGLKMFVTNEDVAYGVGVMPQQPANTLTMNVDGQATMLAQNMPNRFIAVAFLYWFSSPNWLGSPVYTYDGQTWQSYCPGWDNTNNMRTNGIFYNGKHFLCFQVAYSGGTPGSIPSGWVFLQYSPDGVNWSMSTWSNNYSIMYQNSACCANTNVSLFAHDSGGGIVNRQRMSNSLLLYSPQDPNIWRPVTVSWYPGFNWSGSLYQTIPRTLVTNGIFFVYTVGAPGGTLGTGQFSHFISWNGSNWVQSNVGYWGTMDQISFNIGKYIYCGRANDPTFFNRSFNGYNWLTTSPNNTITITGIPTNGFLPGNSLGVAWCQQNITGIAFNSGYYLCGSWSYNGTAPIMNKLSNYASNTGFIANSFIRSYADDPTSFIHVLNANTNTQISLFFTNNFCNVTVNSLPNLGVTVSQYALSLVTNYDIVDIPPFQVPNMDIACYFGPMNYFNLTSNASNFLLSQTLTTYSLLNFNDTVFVQNAGTVGIGAYQATGSKYGIMCNITPAFDVDGRIRINGEAYKPTTGNWTGYSDKRIKENIQPANLKQCYNVLSSIQLKHFSYISSYTGKYNIEDKSQLGFIAQEVSTIFPKSTPSRFNILSTNDTYYDLCKAQLDMSHYGTTQYLISSMYSRSTMIANQQIQLETFEGIYSTIQRF
jgi:hypothetical protein